MVLFMMPERRGRVFLILAALVIAGCAAAWVTVILHAPAREWAWGQLTRGYHELEDAVDVQSLLASERGRASAELAKAQSPYDRWVALGRAAVWAVDDGDLPRATALAQELLDMAPDYRQDWNYGNAIHKANIALGRVALRRGDRALAARHLLEAGRTPGSPQLDSFGPNMILARELVEQGEREAVLEYLRLCGDFWQMDMGKLAFWKSKVSAGEKPTFASNLLY